MEPALFYAFRFQFRTMCKYYVPKYKCLSNHINSSLNCVQRYSLDLRSLRSSDKLTARYFSVGKKINSLLLSIENLRQEFIRKDRWKELLYMKFSPYANFITANFINGLFILLLRTEKRNLANGIFG